MLWETNLVIPTILELAKSQKHHQRTDLSTGKYQITFSQIFLKHSQIPAKPLA